MYFCAYILQNRHSFNEKPKYRQPQHNTVEMNDKTIITFFLLFIVCISTQAQSYKISGYIREAGSRESLVGATVLDIHTQQGAASNSYGFYSLTLPSGKVSLQSSYIGYESKAISFELKKDTVIQIFLNSLSTELDEVVVRSNRSNLENVRLGAISVPVTQLTGMPSLLGEVDIMKSMQMLPGVQSTDEGKSDFSVRGGSPDQNLIILDGIPVYNTNHVFGFLSIFNADAIKSVNLYKAGFPARFGGRLSSVVDIRTDDGNMERLHGSASIGLISMKASLEGPIIKNKTTFNLSYRRTYIDLFMDKILDRLRKMDEDISEKDDYNFYFYDLNAKLQHKFSDKSTAFLMFYNGQDKLTTQYDTREGSSGYLNTISNQDWKWGSTLAAAKWNYIFSGNLFLNTTLAYNRYMYKTDFRKNYTIYNYDSEEEEQHSNISMDYNSGITDYSFTADLDYIPSPKHYIRMGTAYTFHNFNPEIVSQQAEAGKENVVNFNNGNRVYAHELALYAEDEWSVTPRFKVNPGIRFSMFNVQGKAYAGIDPRLSLSYLINNKLSVKAGYAGMKQYIHLLSSNSLFLQTDLWVPVTKNVRPMNSHQYSAGVFYTLPRGFELSVEGYYKDMNHILEYQDGASFLGFATGWENKVEAGKGRSYGVEFFLQKTTGRTTGWLGYTLAKTERRFNQINFGQWFPAKYDRRHTINLTVIQKLGKKFEISGNWVYNSGNVVTVPLVEMQSADLPQNPYYGRIIVEQFEHRNNYRMSAYHRMDLGLTFYTSRNKPRYGVWNLSIYNIYNRKNGFLLVPDYEENEYGYHNGQRILRKITIFPIIPSISYTYKF